MKLHPASVGYALSVALAVSLLVPPHHNTAAEWAMRALAFVVIAVFVYAAVVYGLRRDRAKGPRVH